eukprot:UN31249
MRIILEFAIGSSSTDQIECKQTYETITNFIKRTSFYYSDKICKIDKNNKKRWLLVEPEREIFGGRKKTTDIQKLIDEFSVRGHANIKNRSMVSLLHSLS